MNILAFSHDLPWPANHGGRIDMYNRLKAFKEQNHPVFFVCWALFEDNKSADSMNHIRALVDELVCYKRKEDLINRLIDISFKITKLPIQPNLVTQCSLRPKAFLKLKDQIKKFKPDVIFVDNIYAARLAFKYAHLMNLPVFIRSHNIEHIYIKEMASLAGSLKTRIKFLAMSANLEKYEKDTLKNADAFFDISLPDLTYWKQQGLTNGYWMPPIYYSSQNNKDIPASNVINFDITYIGNLNSPNNVEGLFWFLKEVLPLVQGRYPGVRFLIAGSKPVKSLVDYCYQKSNIELLPNPEDVLTLSLQSRVLINPIRFGSGVNIKTIEMLHLGKPVICTPKAIAGLPKDIELLFDIAENADQFASKILNYLDHPELAPLPRTKMIEYFKPSYLISNIKVMEGFTSQGK